MEASPQSGEACEEGKRAKSVGYVDSLKSPEWCPEGTEGNRKPGKGGDDNKDIPKVTGKVLWYSKQDWSGKGESHPSDRNQETLNRKDDGAGKEKVAIATAVYIVFVVGDEPADSRGDAKVEQYEISSNLLGQRPKAKLLLAKIVKGKGDTSCGIRDIDDGCEVAST